MITTKVVYEVNGKYFDDEKDAMKEEALCLDKEHERIAKKYIEVIDLVNAYARMNVESTLCSTVINVTDEELVPEWFVTKPYSDIFREFLKHLGFHYSSDDGDERRSGYLKIIPDKLIDNVPTVLETMRFIKKAISE